MHPDAMSATDKKDYLLRRKIMERLYGRADHIRDMFRSFDADGSGEISYSEFKDGLAGLGVELTIPEFERLVTYVDNDRNGTIDYSEFAQLLRPEPQVDDVMSPSRVVRAMFFYCYFLLSAFF